MPMKLPTDAERKQAVELLVKGLLAGDDAVALSMAIQPLKIRHNTFPGEVFLRVGGLALDRAGIDVDHRLNGADLGRRFLPECPLRPRNRRKLRYTVVAAAALSRGLDADLLDEWLDWGTEDFWEYGLFAAVVLIRACAAHAEVPVEAFVRRLEPDVYDLPWP
jgi:hypothetical protein